MKKLAILSVCFLGVFFLKFSFELQLPLKEKGAHKEVITENAKASIQGEESQKTQTPTHTKNEQIEVEGLKTKIEEIGIALDEKTRELVELNEEFDFQKENEETSAHYEEVKKEAIELHRKYLTVSNQYLLALESQFKESKHLLERGE